MKKVKRKGWSNAKTIKHDGITFKSGLEKYTYIQLKKHKLYEKYEEEVFELCPGFQFTNSSYERQSNGKKDFKDRGQTKVRGVTYTPDFTGKDYVVECKGFANPTFPLRWKLFKKRMMDNNDKRVLYKPQKQSEVDDMIQTILKIRKDAHTKRNTRKAKA